MPDFFFEIADADPPIPCCGMELDSVAAARAFAMRYAGDLLKELAPSAWVDGDWMMTVLDAGRSELFTLRLAARGIATAPNLSGH